MNKYTLTYYISKFIKKIQVPAIKNSLFHKTSKACSGSQVVNSQVGKYSYIGNYCTIIDANIGKYCSIADYCIIGGSSHPINWVSTSPIFYQGKNILKKNFANHSYAQRTTTVIGNDVWIGSNSLIKAGIEIGDGAIVGMGSVVTKNIGNYEIWAGNPARLIKKRFSEELIDKLNQLKWWDYDDKDLAFFGQFFNNPLVYINQASEHKKD